jgi:hypothetical protein
MLPDTAYETCCFDLTCRDCGSNHVILSGLDADTVRERLQINPQGISLTRGSNDLPLIRFKIFCVDCSTRTAITVQETNDRRVRWSTSPVTERRLPK